MNFFTTKIKLFLFLLVFFAVNISSALAQVSITQATGGQNISVDKAVGGSSEGYTDIGTFTIEDQAAGEFAPGTDRKIYLVPSQAHWQINPSVGTINFGGTNITAASILVENNVITITYTVVGATADDNFISVSGVQVQSTTTESEATEASLRRSTSFGSNSGTITGFANNAVVAPLSEVVGSFAKLLVLLPGETQAPGTLTGKTNTPTDRPAGTAFNATVRAVDAYWNTVATNDDLIQITSNDANATLPANNPLVNGTRNFSVTLRSLGSATVTATNITQGGFAESSVVNVVVGAYSKLVVILPGEEEAPGTATGKTGSAIDRVAGVPFSVKILATDAAGNVVTSINNEISFTATNDANAQLPANASLVNGELTTTATYLTAGTNRRITAIDATANKTGYSTFVLGAGVFAKLLVLLPGETQAPGTLTGKANTPTDRPAGTAFNVTVRAVDAYWNTVATNDDLIQITSNDVNATLPANNPLVNGTRNFSVTLRSLGSATVTATNITQGGFAESSVVNVVIGAYSKLVVILPGEKEAPGIAAGKTGTPTAQVAGEPFNVKIIAVDAAGNIVPSVNSEISFTATNDANAQLPANASLVNGELTTTATYLTAGTNRRITAIDATANKTGYSIFVLGAGTFAKLLVLLPGETYIAGSPGGKTGTPTDRTAGASFSVTVRAVDAYWNTVTTVTDTVGITSNDVLAALPVNAVLVNGIKTNFSIRLNTISDSPATTTITATNITNGTITPYTTAPITVIVGAYTRLVVILPGEEEAPGIAIGKTGTPNAQVAGESFSVKIIAVDAAGNIVPSVNNEISFTASGDIYAQLPANASLVNGELTTMATYRTAGTNRRITATDATANKTGNSTFNLNVGAFAKLLVILPGETYTAGHPNGKTGTPNNLGVGVNFNTIVRAVDAANNTVTSITDTIGITSNDALAVLPANAALANGVKTNFSVRLNTISYNPASTTLTATNITDGAITPYTTDAIVVLVPSAPADYFRSAVVTGNWNVNTSWESSADAISWQPSTLTPTTSSSGITIKNAHAINVTANLSIDDVLIENGGQVNVDGGTLTIAIGGNFVVEGILHNNGRPINTTGTLQFASTGVYQHNFASTSGTIPTAMWDAGSTCEIVRYTSFADDVAGSDQTFSNFVWNAPAQTAAGSPSLLSGFTAANLTVTSTGAGTLNLGSVGGTTTITGNYIQTAGRVNVNKTSGIQNLNIAGDFSVNGGTFDLGNGTVNVRFNGSAQSLVNTGSTIEFQDVRFISGGTKTLNSGNFSLATTGILTMGINTTLNANGNLTILSSASGSGRIAPIPSSSAITGNVNVQRYITGGAQDPYRTNRLLSSPIHTGGNTYDLTQFIDDMIITGAGGSANGFDQTAVNPASAFTYVWGSGFVAIPHINTALEAGKGALIFFRGNRSNISSKTVSPFVDPESIVMDFEGTLNQQDVSVSLNNLDLVGNPYASSIDWNSAGVTKTNLLNNFIRIWNPASRSYAVYDGDGDIAVPEGVISNIIPTGQGFFVQADGAGSLTFTESAKVTTQPPLLLMSAPTEQDLVAQNFGGSSGNKAMAAPSTNVTSFITSVPRTELRLALLNNSLPYKEETAVVFQTGKSAQYNVAEDATYFYNASDQRLFLSSLSSDNTSLTINYMPAITAGSNVKLNILPQNAGGDYQLEVRYKDLPTDYLVKVNDNYLGTSTLVQNGDLYSFSINKTVPASFGDNRLSVSFQPSTTLPVEYTSFTVAKVNQGVAVKWSTLTEADNNRFEIERAGDDQNFVKIHTELAKGNNASYSYIDKNPLLGNNYYRLVQFDNSGKANPTKPQVINYTDEVSNTMDIVSIYPNPVAVNFTVKYNGALKANQQTLKIINATGQVMLAKSIAKAELLAGHEINISNYASGVYVVEVYENGIRIGQTKLVKQ